MAIDFPGSPLPGQTVTIGTTTWKYNGVGWVVVPNTLSPWVQMTQAAYNALTPTQQNDPSILYLIKG